MPRSFWKGMVSFGMVSIPVRMYVATVSQVPAFHMLHEKCLTRPKQVLFCEKDDEYFSQKETVRGFEYARGKYIVLGESDFEKVPVRTTHTIEIAGFIDEAEIDPAYFFGLHYVAPEELGVKPFCLLRESLRQTGRVGLARVSFQRREHLCCLRPLDSLLALHTMRYDNEILPRAEITVPETKLAPKEMEMAASLIGVMAKKFEPGEYHDGYQKALKELIQAKLKGKEVEVLDMPKYEEIPDLMSALKASIEAASRESAARPAGKHKAAAKVR
jgi:DNA end-binding protein Ku